MPPPPTSDYVEHSLEEIAKRLTATQAQLASVRERARRQQQARTGQDRAESDPYHRQMYHDQMMERRRRATTKLENVLRTIVRAFRVMRNLLRAYYTPLAGDQDADREARRLQKISDKTELLCRGLEMLYDEGAQLSQDIETWDWCIASLERRLRGVSATSRSSLGV